MVVLVELLVLLLLGRRTLEASTDGFLEDFVRRVFFTTGGLLVAVDTDAAATFVLLSSRSEAWEQLSIDWLRSDAKLTDISSAGLKSWLVVMTPVVSADVVNIVGLFVIVVVIAAAGRSICCCRRWRSSVMFALVSHGIEAAAMSSGGCCVVVVVIVSTNNMS